MKMQKNKILKIDPEKPALAKIKKAAVVIKKGGLVIFPTDTVYGLGTNALLPKAIRKIYKIKKRPLNKPIILLIASKSAVKKLASGISPAAEKLMEKFWPGPLTLIFKTSPLGCIITGGLSTISLRMPANKIALGLIREAGVPLATTSANISGENSITGALSASDDIKNKVDLIIDGGKSRLGLESTILDMTVFPPRLIREGCIKKDKILRLLESR
ncbi:MAG: L-threonylcarbamoyladenylate synthase [bacterium]